MTETYWIELLRTGQWTYQVSRFDNNMFENPIEIVQHEILHPPQCPTCNNFHEDGMCMMCPTCKIEHDYGVCPE